MSHEQSLKLAHDRALYSSALQLRIVQHPPTVQSSQLSKQSHCFTSFCDFACICSTLIDRQLELSRACGRGVRTSDEKNCRTVSALL